MTEKRDRGLVGGERGRERDTQSKREIYLKIYMFDTERFIEEIEKRPAIYDVNRSEYNDRNAKMSAWEEVCQVMVPNWTRLSDEERNMEGIYPCTLSPCERSIDPDSPPIDFPFPLFFTDRISRIPSTESVSFENSNRVVARTFVRIYFHVRTMRFARFLPSPFLSIRYFLFLEKSLRGKWRNIRDYFMKEFKLQLQKSLKPDSVRRKRKKYMYYDQLLFLMPTVENKLRYRLIISFVYDGPYLIFFSFLYLFRFEPER